MSKNKIFLSPTEMEAQEHLSFDWLRSLSVQPRSKGIDLSGRPQSSFIELMGWVEKTFSYALEDTKALNRFVHNRIIVDGQFMKFCQENGATVEVLHKDSFISWKTEHDYEKYFVQGVFLIKGKNWEFLHAALFHKGNQNEDEISFFVICSEKNYQSYVSFRNAFDTWVQERDRSNLHIRVVEGEDLPYTKDHGWDELFLPPEMKSEIKRLVEDFLSSKDFYLKNKIPWKRGFLLYGEPGNGKTSLIRTLISEYDFKPVTIVPGANDEAVREAFSYAEDQSPSLLFFEDLDSLLDGNLNTTTFLNLMDGISSKNGLLVIATANNVKKLKTSITKRPSRFDRKFEFPSPNLQMAYIYLKTWFGPSVASNKLLKELAKKAVQNKLSYNYLKELYIDSMFEAVAHGRKKPTMADISLTLNRLIKDKNALGGNAISTDKYFQ